jgi:hypothetical protein
MFTGILSTYMVHTDAIKKEFPVTHEAGKKFFQKNFGRCVCVKSAFLLLMIMFDYPNCNRLRE